MLEYNFKKMAFIFAILYISEISKIFSVWHLNAQKDDGKIAYGIETNSNNTKT
jgi:hypothetical protein